jgi:hypothetical protein
VPVNKCHTLYTPATLAQTQEAGPLFLNDPSTTDQADVQLGPWRSPQSSNPHPAGIRQYLRPLILLHVVVPGVTILNSMLGAKNRP